MRYFLGILHSITTFSFKAITAGLTSNYLLTGGRRMDAYTTSPRGFALIQDGALGLALTLVHFSMENCLGARLK
jgi:hypothetical protein